MPLSFAHLWQNQEHSDVDVVLTVAQHSDDADQQQQHSTQLARFPGHSALLSNSPMISAQILRWQHHDKAADEPAPKRRCTRSSTAGDHSISTDDSSSRPQLVLELQDASEEAAALTVLQSLYAVVPLKQLLAQLRQQQLLQAAMLADKWQVPDVSKAAVQALPEYHHLSRELLEQFVQLSAVPTFLLPLLGPVSRACISNSGAGMTADAKRLLLNVLGDLEEVLGDAVLKVAMLALPPRAMLLLLSCDDLKVASEDTVLAATREYVQAHKSSAARAVNALLGPQIRCQHLSLYWLSACVLAKDEGLSALFAPFKRQLKKLLMMRLTGNNYTPTGDDLQEYIEGVPASWGLGQRALREVDSVQLVWLLPIKELRAAFQRSCDEKFLARLECPVVSAPLGGVTFGILVEAEWDADEQGTQLGLFCTPKNAPRDAWCRYRCQIDVNPELSHSTCLSIVPGSQGLGAGDFFELGYMSEWDEEAWAATGLPAEGELLVTITVTACNNTGIHAADSVSG